MLSPLTARTPLADLASTTQERDLGRTTKKTGGHWKPINFAELLSAIEEQAKSLGFKLGLWCAHLHRKGADVAASCPVNGVADLPGDWTPALGVAATNARRYRTHFYVGAMLPNAQSSIVTVSLPLEKRNTIHMDLTATVEAAMQQWSAFARELPAMIRKLKDQEIGREEMNRLQAGVRELGLMPWSRLGWFDARYREMGGQTAWDAIQAYGFVAASNKPGNQFERLLGVYRLLTGQPVTRI
jgi:hypothetical protein